MAATAEQSMMIDRLFECKQDTLEFGKTFKPFRFRRECDEGHYVIQRIIDGGQMRNLIMAPRSTGKTTIVKTFIEKSVCYREARNIVYISKSQRHSERQTEEIKHTLTSPEIFQVFGQLKPGGRDAEWSKERWVTTTGVIVQALGAGMQVRGLIYEDVRPDLIVVDDLEDDECVRNEERRGDLYDWFENALMPTIDLSYEHTKIIVIGTLLHEDALLAKLYEDPDWSSTRLELCNDDFESHYPNYVTDKQIREMYESAVRKRNLDGFYREYRNIVKAPENASFTKECFRYFDWEVPDTAETVILVDPAKTTGERSADSAVVVTSIDPQQRRIYVHEATGGKWHPRELINTVLDLAETYKPEAIGVEKTGLDEYITHPLTDAMLERGRHWNIVPIPAKGKKEDRIQTLSIYYQSGQVYHAKDACVKLEGQLLSFPRSKLWDVMDAFAHLVELKDMGSRFWAADYKESDSVLEKEIEEIENMTNPIEYDYDPGDGDWRII